MRIPARFLAAALLLAAGCSDGGGGDADADSDTDVDTDTDTDSDTGWDLTEPVPAGEARAGQVDDAAALLQGFHADGRVGDFKLYNSRAAFVIQGADGLRGWLGVGGGLLDAAPVTDGVVGTDRLQEIVPLAGAIRVQDATLVEVIADGRGGEPAVIRATGIDVGINMLDIGGPMPTLSLQATMSTEYRLAPDSAALEIVTTMTNQGSERLRTSVGDMIMPGDDTQKFAPGCGLDCASLSSGELSFWAALGPGTSYAFLAEPGESWTVLISLAEVIPMYADKISIAGGDAESFRRYLVVGTGDVDSLRRGIRGVEGHGEGATQEISGSVDSGGDAEGVLVLARGGPGQTALYTYSQASVGEDGAFTLHLPDGEYELAARGPGRPDGAAVTITVAGAAADADVLALGPPAVLSYSVTDGSGQPSPCRISLQAGGDAAITDRVEHFMLSADGTGTQRLLPGEYTATLSRGYEFEIDRQVITLVAGQATELSSVLVRAFDTPGFAAADFHCHDSASPDSTQPYATKVAGQAADGLDFFVTTNHDAMVDLSPEIATQGLGAMLSAEIGIEISPPYGHSNALGVTPTADTPQYNPIAWADYDALGQMTAPIFPPATWEQARGMGARVIQVNHPRSFDAYFDFVDLDAASGVPGKRPEAWSTEFDAIELFNGLDSAGHVLGKTLPDWYAFLDRGMNRVATGNSDQHEPDQMGGNVRNFVHHPDSAGAPDAETIFENLLAFRSQVSSGPYIELSVDGAGIGDTVAPGGATLQVRLTVRAAGFVPVDYVRIVGNGEVLFEESFEDPGTPLRFDRTIELTPTVDTWVHALAGHSALSPRPLHSRGSLAFTNPIWIDLHGDGFDPPK